MPQLPRAPDRSKLYCTSKWEPTDLSYMQLISASYFMYHIICLFILCISLYIIHPFIYILCIIHYTLCMSILFYMSHAMHLIQSHSESLVSQIMFYLTFLSSKSICSDFYARSLCALDKNKSRSLRFYTSSLKLTWFSFRLAKFRNPRTTTSGRKVMQGEREKSS